MTAQEEGSDGSFAECHGQITQLGCLVSDKKIKLPYFSEKRSELNRHRHKNLEQIPKEWIICVDYKGNYPFALQKYKWTFCFSFCSANIVFCIRSVPRANAKLSDLRHNSHLKKRFWCRCTILSNRFVLDWNEGVGEIEMMEERNTGRGRLSARMWEEEEEEERRSNHS